MAHQGHIIVTMVCITGPYMMGSNNYIIQTWDNYICTLELYRGYCMVHLGYIIISGGDSLVHMGLYYCPQVFCYTKINPWWYNGDILWSTWRIVWSTGPRLWYTWADIMGHSAMYKTWTILRHTKNIVSSIWAILWSTWAILSSSWITLWYTGGYFMVDRGYII